MLYLYAITDGPHSAVPAGQGIGGYPLFWLEEENLLALVSESGATEPAVDEDNLWMHEAIVDGLMVDRSVLPVRYGTRVAGAAQMRAGLATHHNRPAASLVHIEGRVELGLTVLWNADGATEGPDASLESETGASVSAGRAYHAAGLEQERRSQARKRHGEVLASRVHASLKPLAADSTITVLASQRLLLTASYLVDRRSTEAFRAQVSTLATSFTQLQMVCTGPWPAYGFLTDCLPESHKGAEAVPKRLLQDE